VRQSAIVSLLIVSSLLLSGCAYGVRSRIFATSGNDIALTQSGTVDVAAGQVCPHFVESSYLIEKAGQLKDYVAKDPEKAATPEVSSSPPPCQSFQIHERMVFDSTGSIDIQEMLREEFGTGHEFRNVSIKLKIAWFDWLLNVFTIGIANSQTVEVTGDRFAKGK
jgi:hypothetical protein